MAKKKKDDIDDLDDLNIDVDDFENLKQYKEYIPFSQRVISENDTQKSILDKDIDDSNALYKIMIEKSRKIDSYPELDDFTLMFKSFTEHDLVLKDLTGVMFDDFKHVDGKRSDKDYSLLKVIANALSIAEKEKRNPVINFFKKKKNRI